MGESGGSAQRRAEDLLASGDAAAAAWRAGAEGERRVAEALTALGEPWVVLHDRLLRPGLTESNLDHVVVGPAGVVLVDAKNWGGNVTEWNGNLYQHRWDAAGQATHEAKHAEIAKVHAMGREMAERLAVPVTSVLCLAGSRSAQFGEPRQVRGIWVVPLGRLVEWVQARPRVVDVESLGRLSTLVMTEFPSTTTDPELLAAIGADLARGQASRRSSRLRMTGRAGLSAGTRRPPTGGRRPSTGGRTPLRGPGRTPRRGARQSFLRPLVGLLVLAGLWWGMSHGLAQWFGDVTSGLITKSVLGASAPEHRPAPDALSCSDFDPKTAKMLENAELTAVPKPMGCDWYASDSKGSKALALRLQEVTGASEALNPMLDRSRTTHAPEVHDGYGSSGKATVFWVASGARLSTAKQAPTATRSLTVQVSHDLLGLSAKQARQLATAVATSASARHEPVEPTPAPTG